MNIDSVLKVVRGIFRLRGSTDNTLIGNVGDSLKTNVTASVLPTGASTSANQVTGNFSLSSIDSKLNTLGQKTASASVPVVLASNQQGLPSDPRHGLNVVYLSTMLKNGTSEVMTVNGSGTPVNFDFVVPAGQTNYVEQLSLFVQHNGTVDPEDFGSIANGITNGIDVKARINGVEYVLANIKNNMQLNCFFADFGWSPASGAGWYNNNDSFFGSQKFRVPLKLTQSTGDYIRVTVRDNLRSVNNLRMGVVLWRVV